MTQFLGAKVAQYGLVLLVTITLNFLLPRLMPGSPLAFIAGEDVAQLSAADRAAIMRAAGLDRPVHEQYVTYLGGVVRGDLGFSFQQRKPVATMLLERLPWTMLLVGTALVLSTLVGVVFGALAAWRRGRSFDLGSLGVFVFLESLPNFWLGMILVAVFAVNLQLLPSFGARDLYSDLRGLEYVADVARHLVLPAATLTLVTVSATFLTMRYSLLQVLGEDYVMVARAKGLAEGQVLFRHAVRNALLPVATLFLLRLGTAVAGATAIETVFSYPGLGRLVYEAARTRDFPMLQGALLLLTVSVVVANLVADLLYPLLDPRVTHAGGRPA